MPRIDIISRTIKRLFHKEITPINYPSINIGVISVFSQKSMQFDLFIEGQSTINCSVDGIEVIPSFVSTSGNHSFSIIIQPDLFEPSAIVEGELIIESSRSIRKIRITGVVDGPKISDHSSVSVINSRPWELVKSLSGTNSRIRALVFIDNGKKIVSGSDDCVLRIWDLIYGKHENVECPAPIWSIAATRDNKLLAVGLQDGSIFLLETNSLKTVWNQKIHSGTISGLAFTPNGAILIAGSGDRSISVWNTAAGTMLYPPLSAPVPSGKKPGVITSVAIANNGLVFVAASQTRNIDLWEISSGRHLRKLTGHQGNVWTVIFSLDGHYLVSGSYDKSVRIWDTETGEELRKIDGFLKDIYCVDVSPNGKLIATASGEPKVRIWLAENGKRMANLECGNIFVWKLAFSPNQELLAGALHNGTINLWTVD